MTQGSRRPVTFSVRAADSAAGEAHTQQVPLPPPTGTSPGSWASDPDAAVLRALGAQLTRECPHLAGRSLRDRAGAGVGLHRVARRTAWLAVVADRPGSVRALPRHQQPLAALGVAGTLVPGCLLTSCERSQLIELERASTGLAADATVVNKPALSAQRVLGQSLPRPKPTRR